MGGIARDRRIFMFLINTVAPLIAKKYNVKAERYKLTSEPSIILCNHTTNFDFIWVGLSLKTHMYIVASDHLHRLKYAGKLLDFFFAPIWRVKSSSDITTIKKIVKTIKNDTNVLLFPEGNRSYNGINAPISDSTGKLIKMCRVPMVTCRIEGGYLMQPRWAKRWRKGLVKTFVVNEYSEEQIDNMSVEEINAVIRKDLNEDAYLTQEKEKIAFKGEDLAEYLETSLYICPKCKRIATLKTQNDRIFCDCGFVNKIDEYGFFKGIDGEEIPFKSVFEWDKWQKEEFNKHKIDFLNHDKNEVILSDENQNLHYIHNNIDMTGTLKAFKDRFEFECNSGNSLVFHYNEVHDMQVVARQNLMFSVTGIDTFDIRCDAPRNAYKYIDIHDMLKHTT